MEKLELKHLAPYLPYKLVINCDFNDGDIRAFELEGLTTHEAFLDGADWNYQNNTDFKPILRPLSDLTTEIEIDGYKFIPNNLLNERFRQSSKDLIPYQYTHHNLELEVQTENYSQTLDLYDGYLIVNQLFEWHFDVFGLIPKGLAISYSDVRSTSNEG